MAEPVPDPTQEFVESVAGLLANLSSDPEASQQLTAIKDENELLLFYTFATIINSIEPQLEPTDEGQLILVKAACVTARPTLIPSILRSAQDLAAIFANQYGPEKTEVIKQAFYKCLGWYDTTIRKTGADIVASLIQIQLLETRRPPMIDELNALFADASVSIYMKSSIIHVFDLLLYRSIITRRYRFFRPFCNDLLQKSTAFLAEGEIPNSEKVESLVALQQVIVTLPNCLSDETAFGQINELLIQLVKAQTEFDRDFHRELYRVFTEIFYDPKAIDNLSVELVNAIFEATGEDIGGVGQTEEGQSDFIVLWRNIAKAQYSLLSQHDGEEDLSGYIFMGDVLESLLTALVQIVVDGQYEDILDPSSYVLPLRALDAIGTIGNSFKDETIQATVDTYNQLEDLASKTTDNSQVLVAAMCVLQVIIGIKTDETDEFIGSKIGDIYTLMQSGIENVQAATLNVINSFIEKKVSADMESAEAIFGPIVENLNQVLQCDNANLLHRTSVVFDSFFSLFGQRDQTNYLAENFETFWGLIDAFITKAATLNSPSIEKDSFNILLSFIHALPIAFNDALLPFYMQYVEKLQQALQGGAGQELIDNLYDALSVFVNHLGTPYKEHFHPLVQILIAALAENISANGFNTLSSLTYRMREDIDPYTEPILELFNTGMVSDSGDILCASLTIISDLYNSLPGKDILVGKAPELAMQILEFTKGIPRESYALLNSALSATAAIVNNKFMPLETFIEVRDQFVEFFQNISIEIKNIKINDKETAANIASSLFLCFKNVIEFHESEREALYSNETRESCFLWNTRDIYFQFIKTVYEIFLEEGSFGNNSILWCFCQMLHEIVNVMGRPCNLQLNSRWTTSLYTEALHSHDLELKVYANSFKKQFDQC